VDKIQLHEVAGIGVQGRNVNIDVVVRTSAVEQSFGKSICIALCWQSMSIEAHHLIMRWRPDGAFRLHSLRSNSEDSINTCGYERIPEYPKHLLDE
jgi:hypothetical protein